MQKLDRILNIVGLAGLFLFVISMPFSPALSEAGFDIGLLVVIIKLISNRRIVLPPKVYNLALVLFVVFVSTTIPFSMDPGLSVRKFGIVRWLAFPYVVLNLNIDSKTTKRLLYLLLSVSGVFSIFLIAQHFAGRAILPYKFDVFQTVDFANRNLSDRIALRFGQYYAMLFTFVVVYTYFNRQLKRIKHIIIMAVSAIISITTTYLAYARSGAAGIWTSFVLFGILRARTILYAAIILTLLGLAFIFLFPHTEAAELFYSTIHPTRVSGVRYGSNIARIHMIENTEQILKRHPFVGIGFNCYGKWTSVYKPEDKGWERTFSDPLEFLATTGIIGFLGFLILYMVIFYILLKAHDALSYAVFATFIVFAGGGVFEPMFFNTVLLRGMMFLISLSMAMSTFKQSNP
ncbi:MAG: O-antigen ligase family protein [bacterium]